MQACTNVFSDFLVSCGYMVRLNAVFVPLTQYTWVIGDKFGNEYSGTATTDADGNFYIYTTDLPDGILNPYSGTFTLRVMNTECQWLPLRMMRVYDAVVFEVKGGDRVKDELGCQIDCTISGTPSNSAVYETFAVAMFSIEWTSALRTLYGNSPQVQVFEKLSNGVYVSTSVQITWNGTDGLLDSLDFDFGGGGNFLIIVRG